MKAALRGMETELVWMRTLQGCALAVISGIYDWLPLSPINMILPHNLYTELIAL